MTQYNDIAYNIRIKVTDVSDLSPTTKLMALPGFTKNSSLSPYVSVELGDVHLGRTVTREVQPVLAPSHIPHNTLSNRISSADSSRDIPQISATRSPSTSTASSKDSALSTTAYFDEEFSEVINNIDEELQLRIFHEALIGDNDFLAEVEIDLRSQVFDLPKEVPPERGMAIGGSSLHNRRKFVVDRKYALDPHGIISVVITVEHIEESKIRMATVWKQRNAARDQKTQNLQNGITNGLGPNKNNNKDNALRKTRRKNAVRRRIHIPKTT